MDHNLVARREAMVPTVVCADLEPGRFHRKRLSPVVDAGTVQLENVVGLAASGLRLFAVKALQ